MDEACKGLEIEFKRVVNDLEYCSHHFENEFHNRPASNNIDVVSLIRRISALETSLQSTKRRSDDLVAHRQRVTSTTASIMLQNHARLSRLLEEMGALHTNEDIEADKENMTNNDCDEEEEIKVEDFTEAHEELASVLRECTFFDASKLLTASTAFPPPLPAGIATASVPSSSGLATKEQYGQAYAAVTDLPAPPVRQSPLPLATAPAAPAATTPAFDLISTVQFEAIPVSTRGRCKLADVQAVLSRLVSHYTTHAGHAGKKHGKPPAVMVVLQSTPPVSLSDLGNGGLKVTGKTGDCVLGALRVLGLVKMVSAGGANSKGSSGTSSKGSGSGSGFDTSGATSGPGLVLSDHAIQALHAQLARATAAAASGANT